MLKYLFWLFFKIPSPLLAEVKEEKLENQSKCREQLCVEVELGILSADTMTLNFGTTMALETPK